MSVPPLGYNSGSTSPLPSSLLIQTQNAPLTPQSGNLTSHPATSCCENGRPIITDPHTGQSICSCQYGSTLLSAYSRVPGLADSMYTSPHYATQGYMPLNSDTSAFYSPLNPAHYDSLKDTPAAEAWRGITQPTACYPYDPTMAAYPYPNTYGGMDLNGAARRKNATRETTNTLKAWLYEHRKNPYPTKGEKIMLAIITKMTLTQVSTWFANARRRLKKENKMTWSPRNRCGDDDDDMDKDDDANDENDNDDKMDSEKSNNDGLDTLKDDKGNGDARFGSLKELKVMKGPYMTPTENRLSMEKLDVGLSLTPPPLKPPQATLVHEQQLQVDLKRLGSPCSNSSDSGLSDINGSMSTNGSGSDPSDPLRPRIWSLAHEATSTVGNNVLAQMQEIKDLNANLTALKPGFNSMTAPAMSPSSFCSTGNTMRPWLDTTFNVGSSLFSPMSGTYSTLGTQRQRDTPSSVVNQSLNSLSTLSGLSPPGLSRTYPNLSSLYAPTNDLAKRNIDKMPDLRS